MPSIVMEELSKRYGSLMALDSLSLTLEGGRCVGFLGPNGAGKTTTLKLLTDLIKPTSGKASINGYDVHTEKRRALERCGALVETPEIYPSLTPREALSLLAEMRGIRGGEREERVKAVIEEVKMEDWMDSRIGKFSKGMKQRINIASTLLAEPEIIILDEPTSGLDPRGMAEVREMIRSLKRKNILIFMSSHLLSEVQDICDDVAIVDHGKLLVHGPLSEVTSKFLPEGAKRTIDVQCSASVDDALKSKVASIEGVVSVDGGSGRMSIAFSGGSAAQAKLLEEMVKLNIGVYSFREATTSPLEETYMRLIKETL